MVHEKVCDLNDCFILSGICWAAGVRCWRYSIGIIVQSAICYLDGIRLQPANRIMITGISCAKAPPNSLLEQICRGLLG
jgi:hypothetical protein